jgi:hypothetical protein
LLKRRSRLGCALTFASEAKFETEAKISFFAWKRKKTLISHDSLRCETPKILSENEGKIRENSAKKTQQNKKLSEKKQKKRKKTEK